jgi:E3 ubiquitin-protein ligase SIAH1
MPQDFFCIVPKAEGTDIILQTTIDNELVYDEEDKLEDEDDDD